MRMGEGEVGFRNWGWQDAGKIVVLWRRLFSAGSSLAQWSLVRRLGTLD